jgi:hypothetical protein
MGPDGSHRYHPFLHVSDDGSPAEILLLLVFMKTALWAGQAEVRDFGEGLIAESDKGRGNRD